MRILIYTGKGGVGKTSIAAATAVRIAAEGKKVLIMSTDQAHSLKDSFDIESSGNSDVCKISDRLDVLEVDIAAESRKAWGSLQDYFREIISNKANSSLAADEALLFPGFEELFALLRVLDIYEAAEYEVIIVDCAPTGETLSLLRYPERLSVVADKILPMVRSMTKTFGGLISKKTSVPKPRDVVFAEFDALVKRLNQLRKILQDREITSLRLVMSPERIVIDEARRSYTWIQLYDFGADAVYVNRIYPEKALMGYFEGWDEMQKESLAIVDESFSELKQFRLEMQDEEVRGLPMLEKIGNILYEGENPETVYCRESAFRIEERNGTRVFIVNLPYAIKEELDVYKDDKDLILTFRNEKRRFRLPDKLIRRYISSWEFENGELAIFMDYD